MHTAAGIGAEREGDGLIRRIVLFAILLLALIEPLIMYASLMHERAQRRAVAESSLSGSALVSGN